ncbi:MAG: YybH family protein [Terriglobales bacterium]
MRVATLLIMALAVTPVIAQKKAPARPPRATARAAETKQPSEQEDQRAINELQQREIAASLALDVDKLVSLWDDGIVSLPQDSPPVVGLEANRARLVQERERMENVEIMAYEQRWDEVRIVGDYAFEYGSIQSRLRPENAKQETSITLNAMRVLKRETDGTWKIYRTIANTRSPAPEQRPAETKPSH